MIKSFRGRTLDKNKKIIIYRNLNRKGVTYSIKQDDLVIGHTQNVVLRDCVMKVNLRGVSLIREEKVRRVVAVIEGYLCESTKINQSGEKRRLYYNPYRNTHFHNDNNDSIEECDFCCFGETVEYI